MGNLMSLIIDYFRKSKNSSWNCYSNYQKSKETTQSFGKKAKSFFKKAALSGLAALIVYSGTCYNQRKPRIVKHYDNIAGAQIDIIGRKNYNFPTVHWIEDIIWPVEYNTGEGYWDTRRKRTMPKSKSFKTSDGSIKVIINQAINDQIGWALEKNWEEYVKNHNSLVNSCKNPKSKECKNAKFYFDGWKEVWYNLFKNTPRKEIHREFMEESFKSKLAHELTHVRDHITNFGSAESETRAFLKELTVSPIDLYYMDILYRSRDPPTFPVEYVAAARRVYIELEKYPDTHSLIDVVSMPRKKLSKRAQEVYDKLYPKN